MARAVLSQAAIGWPLNGSIPHRCADHFQDTPQAIIPAHAAFVKRSSRDGLPVVA